MVCNGFGHREQLRLRRPLRPRGLWTAAALVTFAVKVASADVSATELAVARRLFDEATMLERTQMWSEATAKLKAALAIKETPGLRYHLAFCEEKQGLLVEAQLDYDRAAELIQRGARARDVEARLESAREALRIRVPTLTLDLPVGVSGVNVQINDHSLSEAVAERPIPLNPGHYLVSVRAKGRKAFATEFDINESEHKTLVVFLPKDNDPRAGDSGAQARPAPAANIPSLVSHEPGAQLPTAQRPVPGTRSSAFSWVIGAESLFASVALGTGVFFSLQAANAKKRAEMAQDALWEQGDQSLSICHNDPRPIDCDELFSAQDDQKRAVQYSIIGYSLAGLGAVTMVGTWLLWPKYPKVQVTLHPGPVGTSVTVSGNF